MGRWMENNDKWCAWPGKHRRERKTRMAASEKNVAMQSATNQHMHSNIPVVLKLFSVGTHLLRWHSVKNHLAKRDFVIFKVI